MDDLIAEMCPAGVPVVPLGDVGTFTRGNGLQKKDLIDDGIGAIHYGQVFTVYGTATEVTKSFVSPGLAVRLRMARPGDLIIATTSENDEDVCKAVAWLGPSDIAISGDSYAYSHVLDPLYVSYYFQTEAFQAQKRRHITGTKVRRVSGADLARITIPVPPLEVQHEIAATLKKFEALSAELKAELEARQEQRLALAGALPAANHLRAPGSKRIRRVRIGEVATQYVEPLRVQPDETYTNLGVHWYGEGAFARDSKPGSAIKGSILYRVKPGQFIYNRMFAIEGSFGVITPELAGGVVSNEFPVYDLDDELVLPGWLLFVFQDEYTLKRVAAQTTGVERGTMKSRRRWKEEQFEAFQIDLPSLADQRELVRALDACSALESALRDELAARGRQYEYYLDRLLTFREAA